LGAPVAQKHPGCFEQPGCCPEIAHGDLEFGASDTEKTAIPQGRAAQLETLGELFERLTQEERAEFIREQFLSAAGQPNRPGRMAERG
jgi:hypothetical protein